MDISEHNKTRRRRSTFDTSGYQTENNSSDEESMIPDWLWSQQTRHRSTLESGFEEYIQPSTQPLEYKKFVSHLPPAFARYQQEIYGPRDPITGEPLGVEPGPLTTSPDSTREPYTSTPLTTRRPTGLETGFESHIESDHEEEYYDEDYDEEFGEESSISLSIPDIEQEQVVREQKYLPHLLRDKEMLSQLGYDLYERIGSGCYGYVYRGVCNEFAFKRYRDESTADPNDPNSGVWNEISLNCKKFAVKFLLKEITDHEEDDDGKDLMDEKLISEAKYMLELNHMNVVDVYHVTIFVLRNTNPRSVTHPTELIKLYIIMEFSELGDIRRFIKEKKGGIISVFLYKEIVRQSIEGLLYIHSKNIVHNDIKETNFLVFTDQTTGDYIFKYSDFGLSAIKGLNGFKNDLNDLCGFWKSLLTYLRTDSEFTQLMRDFIVSLPSRRDWIYETLQVVIDDNPWLLE